jgi:peptide-methionine (S)-S-oxide reductase
VTPANQEAEVATGTTELATLAGGCFWCLEAVYLELRGVSKVVSGYAGGHRPNPTYEQVCSGATGHAEVVQITFDPAVISFRDLLDVFFTIHDPTTLNRQGNDSGTQYRSAIFYHSPQQELVAREAVAAYTALQLWDDPIVTEVVPLEKFWPAEAYHQNYFATHPGNPYCAVVIAPKVGKARKVFFEKLAKQPLGS